MPFTPAHVVAAVPLARPLGARGVVSALAIGSITPDLAYFLPLDVVRSESHTVAALVWFCLPVGLWVFGFFHLCVAPLVFDVTPAPVRERLPASWALGRLPRVGLGAVAISIVVGAATHLAWDSFTHYGTPLTRAVPLLAVPMGELGGFTVRPVRIAQHLSTAFGLGLLLVWGGRWIERAPRVARRSAPPPWLAALLVAAIVLPTVWLGVTTGLYRAQFGLHLSRKLMGFVQGVVYTGGSTFCASLIAVATVWRALRDARWITSEAP